MSFSILWTKESDKTLTNTNLNMNQSRNTRKWLCLCVLLHFLGSTCWSYQTYSGNSLGWMKNKPSTTNDQPQLFRASATFPPHDLLMPEVTYRRIGHVQKRFLWYIYGPGLRKKNSKNFVYLSISRNIFVFKSTQNDIKTNTTILTHERVLACRIQKTCLVPSFDDIMGFFNRGFLHS